MNTWGGIRPGAGRKRSDEPRCACGAMTLKRAEHNAHKCDISESIKILEKCCPMEKLTIKRSRIKPKRSKPRRTEQFRDRKYLDWLKIKACCACRREVFGITEPAHGPSAGIGLKGPDNEAIPLCRLHHLEQHRIGWSAFESKYGFSRETEAAAHWILYGKESGIE